MQVNVYGCKFECQAGRPIMKGTLNQSRKGTRSLHEKLLRIYRIGEKAQQMMTASLKTVDKRRNPGDDLSAILKRKISH